MASSFDMREFAIRLLKYLIEGLAVSTCLFFLNSKIPPMEIISVGMVAGATFALLDLFSPSIGSSARSGAGLSIGAGLVGGIPTQAGAAMRVM